MDNPPPSSLRLRRRTAWLIAGALAIASLIPAWWVFTREDPEEEVRYEKGLTRLVVANVAGAEVSIRRAGAALSGASSETPLEGGESWLEPGNYILEFQAGGKTACLPVPLTGYRCGPDDDGDFAVTLRRPPPDGPSAAIPGVGASSFIPGGSFLIGDRQNPRERHYVWLTGFFMGQFEVTNRDFRAFFDAPDGYAADANWTAEGLTWRESTPCEASSRLAPTDSDVRRFGLPDHPVTMVSWYEANAFCRWLTLRHGAGRWIFSLPTDAEWEKAARGPDNFDYGLGMEISDREAALYNWKKNPGAPVTVVGIDSTRRGFTASRWGLYHATGNVAEWTQSADRPYNREHPYADDERNGDEAAGPRTVRGGSWYSAAISYLQIPYRDTFQPEHRTKDTGFRVVARILP